jgi:transposase-like protein
MAESLRQRRVFSDAFKLEAVAAIRGGCSVAAIAAELELPDRLVHAWLRWTEGRSGSERRAASAGGGSSSPLMNEPHRSSAAGTRSCPGRWCRSAAL